MSKLTGDISERYVTVTKCSMKKNKEKKRNRKKKAEDIKEIKQ